MPTYQYVARNRQGNSETGVADAKSEDELIRVLQSQQLMVVSFKQLGKADKTETRPFKKRKMHKAVKLDDLIVLAKQLQALIGAGITLIRSLEIINLQIQSKKLFDAVETIKQDISAGSSLKLAIEKHPNIFTNIWVNIIETGETTGQLPFALEQLVDYLESSSSLQRKIKSALAYPVIVLCVATAAVALFIVKIIPTFADIYKGFGAALPVFTQTVFDICFAIKQYLPFILGIIASAYFVMHHYRKTHDGRKRIDAFILDIPLLGDVIKQISAVRFASGLNMLIKSGTPILHALDIVIETSGNVIVKEMLQDVKENVREGKPMSEPLLKGQIFPDMLSHMVAVGEESGELANMLENAAQFYEERIDATVSRLATMFEPMLIVVIGVIVGTLVIAMFLPIFGLAGAMGG
jgi:type IV pilus assembly protein PilC